MPSYQSGARLTARHQRALDWAPSAARPAGPTVVRYLTCRRAPIHPTATPSTTKGHGQSARARVPRHRPGRPSPRSPTHRAPVTIRDRLRQPGPLQGRGTNYSANFDDITSGNNDYARLRRRPLPGRDRVTTWRPGSGRQTGPRSRLPFASPSASARRPSRAPHPVPLMAP